jgi:hypothetical protein
MSLKIQTSNFACFASDTGKITVLMVEQMILLVSEEKQAKFEIWNFWVPMARWIQTWISPDPSICLFLTL